MASIEVRAPMAGSIKELFVRPGEVIFANQELLLIESMKMEIPLESPAGGVVEEILVGPSDRIDEGQVLLRLTTE